MSTRPLPPPATIQDGVATGISSVYPDILEAHILTRLDGPTLASASCVSSSLNSLFAETAYVWSHICHSTWPSTASPRVSHLVSSFPNGGPRSFFSQSFPLPASSIATSSSPNRPSELISAVDIHFKGKLIFSKVQETETLTGWFRCSPFRVDLLDPKDAVPTQTQHPDKDETCSALMDDITLSWILIDPVGSTAVNLSSHKPVTVQQHWLSREVQIQFATVLQGDPRGPSAAEFVQCEVVITCGESEGGEMQLREVSLEVEDMDGTHLNGGDSLVILQRALEGKRGTGKNREVEGRRRYKEYLERKRERKERKMMTEGALDTLCVALGVSIFAAFCFFILCRLF